MENNIQIEKDFFLDEVLRDYSSNSKDDQVIEKISRYKNILTDKPILYVGTGTCGLGAGAGKTFEKAESYLKEKNIDARIIKTGCIGLCSSEPILDVQIPGYNRISFEHITEEKVEGLLDSVFNLKIPSENIIGQFKEQNNKEWENVQDINEHPFFVKQKRIVLKNCGIIDPVSINEYIACGGYKNIIKAISNYESHEVCQLILDSGLKGRGGGGFLTGMKWKFANSEKSDQKYLICNADEGDPGAFMDRAVIEGDPHKLLEGMAIAAYAIGASKAYVYIRAEYPLAIARLKIAIDQAREYGILGDNIFNTGIDFDIKVKMGAGAFVCGEETALIHSIEGKRGMPRPRPPFPTTSGLFEKPTVINNVETLSNVSTIIEKGSEWFTSIGTDKSKGTKVFALSGKISLTGLVEVPMGTSIREVLFNIAGGCPNGKKFKAVQIGGPSGGCITEENLDIPIDYSELIEKGAMMGSGGMVVMDEDTCMVDIAKFFMNFIQRESCGKCIPCREGTKRMLEILESITSKPTNPKSNEALERFRSVIQLEKLAKVIKETSLCGLGQSAPNPVLSTLRYFRDEYDAHIYDKQCPAGVCKNLRVFKINVDACTGCTVCAKKCPTGAIIGAKKTPHFIVEDKCIGCGACFEACKFNAIEIV